MELNIVGLIISVPEFIWTIINFFLLMFLLKKFLYEPILKVMDERKAGIDASLAEGREAEKALEENKAKLDAELGKSGNAARELIGSAKSAADKEKSKVLAEAHNEAAGIHKEVRQRIENEEAEAVSDIEKNMPELVKLLTGALLQSEESADDALVQSCMKE